MRVGVVTFVLAALIALVVLDPFSGPRTAEQRLNDARLSGGKTAELWLVTFDVANALESYVQEHGALPQELDPVRPYLSGETADFLLRTGN